MQLSTRTATNCTNGVGWCAVGARCHEGLRPLIGSHAAGAWLSLALVLSGRKNPGMTTTAEELAELRTAVRGVLCSGSPEQPPEPDPGWRSNWPELAAMGLAGFCVPAAAGGFGDEFAAAAVVALELGAGLHGAPFPGVVAAAAALGEGAPDLVAGVLDGRLLPAVAVLDGAGAVTADGDRVRVEGVARLVVGADDADGFVVLGPPGAPMVWVAAADTSLGDRHGFDPTRSCADVTFPGSPGRALSADAALRQAVSRRHGLLLAADTLGGVLRSHARAVAYAKERVAFGSPIGGFQAVQHRLVDHAVTLRGLSLLVDGAASALTAGDPDLGRRAVLAEAGVARRAVPVLHDLVQLTGAVGFTWEYGLHLFERRAQLNARAGGNPRTARTRLAQLAGWTGST